MAQARGGRDEVVVMVGFGSPVAYGGGLGDEPTFESRNNDVVSVTYLLARF